MQTFFYIYSQYSFLETYNPVHKIFAKSYKFSLPQVKPNLIFSIIFKTNFRPLKLEEKALRNLGNKSSESSFQSLASRVQGPEASVQEFRYAIWKALFIVK